jgi:hypothetical protein
MRTDGYYLINVPHIGVASSPEHIVVWIEGNGDASLSHSAALMRGLEMSMPEASLRLIDMRDEALMSLMEDLVGGTDDGLYHEVRRPLEGAMERCEHGVAHTEHLRVVSKTGAYRLCAHPNEYGRPEVCFGVGAYAEEAS